MPIVVDEVVISVEVEEAPGGPKHGAASAARSGSSDDERQLLVAEAVERVLEILARRQER
jgi:hypothetical protein